jgi:hypothetical protein
MKQMPTLRSMVFRSFCLLAIVLTIWQVPASNLGALSAQFESGRRFDTFGSLRTRDENIRLDNLAAQLKQEPTSKGYLVLYEGRNDQIRNLKDLACRCLRHIVDKRGVNANQVLSMLIMGGHRPKFTVQLLIWPLYAPDDLPRFQPDVSRKEITIIKGVDLAKQCGRPR